VFCVDGWGGVEVGGVQKQKYNSCQTNWQNANALDRPMPKPETPSGYTACNQTPKPPRLETTSKTNQTTCDRMVGASKGPITTIERWDNS
jgi:hypothetical protein